MVGYACAYTQAIDVVDIDGICKSGENVRILLHLAE